MLAVPLEQHGPPDVLAVKQCADPRPRPGEVVVELRAAAVNRRDALVRAGSGPHYRFPLPLVIGSDGAGVRRDTGEEVVLFPALEWGPSEDVAGPDLRILGGPEPGTYAELVAVREDNLFPRPPGLSWEEAAALPLASVTAHRALFRVGRLRRGECVAVLGMGGVSIAAVQLAVHAGARVAVTTSSPQKAALARELGAEAAVDRRDPDWVEQVRDGAGPADLVLDSSGSTWPEALELLRPGGRLVSCGATGGALVTLDVRRLYLQQKRILGTRMGSPADFRAVLDLVADGGLRPVVDSVRPLSDAAQAHARIESGDHLGKLVLRIP